MASVAVIFATSEGQTRKVAEKLVDHLGELGHAAESFDVKRLPGDLDLAGHDAVLVGGSIHLGKHHKRLTSFVRTHRDELATMPSGFFQVSLSTAVDDESRHAEAMGYIDEFVEVTGWQPDKVALFGGALRYSEYGFLTRSLMKSIAKDATGDTDTSRDYEYTDWEEVRAFAEDFGAFVEEQVALRAMGGRDAPEEAR